MAKNIDETMGYIFNGGKIPNKLGGSKGEDWGKPFGNNENYLPSVTEEGTAIKYQEYKVRSTEPSSNWQADTNRIVVGNDGTYYYSNTHLGDSIKRGETGIPFYKAGTLPDETVKKLFGE